MQLSPKTRDRRTSAHSPSVRDDAGRGSQAVGPAIDRRERPRWEKKKQTLSLPAEDLILPRENPTKVTVRKNRTVSTNEQVQQFFTLCDFKTFYEAGLVRVECTGVKTNIRTNRMDSRVQK